jgi:hypothetical protein
VVIVNGAGTFFGMVLIASIFFHYIKKEEGIPLVFICFLLGAEERMRK